MSMSRLRRSLAALAGIALALGLLAPAAPAQCPFQAQMWYQVQMQRWSSQQQQWQSQRFQPAPMTQAWSQPMARPMQPSVFRPSMGLEMRPGLVNTLRPSLSLEFRPGLSQTFRPSLVQGHGLGRPVGLSRTITRPAEMRLRLGLTGELRPALRMRLTNQLRRLSPGRPLEPGRLIARRTALEPGERLVPRAIRTAGAIPVVTGGIRFTCAGNCHAQLGQPLQAVRLPQQPNLLQAPFPLPQPVRMAPPPELALMNLLQALRQRPAALPQRAPLPLLRADVPVWLRGVDQPPAVGRLLRLPAPTPAQRGRPADPTESLWSRETNDVDPFAPGRAGDGAGLTALRRALEAPPPPPADELSRLARETPILLVAPEDDSTAIAGAGPSLEALLESPPPPPTIDALLPPAPDGRADTGRVARLADGGTDLDSLLEPPPPGRSVQ
jgi:hypothetical protein